MNPPSAVRITTALMFLSILVGLVIVFTTPATTVRANAVLPVANPMALMRGGGLILSLIATAFVVCYFKGMNWARWLVMIDSLFHIISLVQFSKAWTHSHLGASLLIFNALLAVYLLYYLNSAEAKAYFMPKSPEYANPPVA